MMACYYEGAFLQAGGESLYLRASASDAGQKGIYTEYREKGRNFYV